MNLENLKIGSRLILGFGLLVLTTALLGMFSVFQILEISKFTTDMYKHPLTVNNVVRDFQEI